MNSSWRDYKIKTNQNTAYRLWNGGMFNQFISLEIAIGISYLINDCVHIHDMRRLPSHSDSFEEKNNFISDFIDLSCFNKIYFTRQKIDKPSSKQIHVKNLMNHFIYVQNKFDYIEDFSEGREGLFIESNKSYYFDHNLSYYSIMFFNRTREFDLHLKQLSFKKEYIDFADYISKEIGIFSGIHLRQTDFSRTIYAVKMEEYRMAIETLKKKSNLVIVSTDDLQSPLLKKDGSVLMIDDLIKDNFMKEFNHLTISSKISFDLICMLVMCNSVDFIGTIGSTYSGLIHRHVNEKSKNTHHWSNMGDHNNVAGFPFSWNSYDKILISQKLWWREWKESYIR